MLDDSIHIIKGSVVFEIKTHTHTKAWKHTSPYSYGTRKVHSDRPSCIDIQYRLDLQVANCPVPT